jgi:hypothetical protein
VPKFHGAFPFYILAMSNGSSMRVLAQGICRRMSKDSPEAQRAAILNAIRGIRNQSRSVVTVQVKQFVIPTPTGDVVVWSGTDGAEFMAADNVRECRRRDGLLRRGVRSGCNLGNPRSAGLVGVPPALAVVHRDGVRNPLERHRPNKVQ